MMNILLSPAKKALDLFVKINVLFYQIEMVLNTISVSFMIDLSLSYAQFSNIFLPCIIALHDLVKEKIVFKKSLCF